MFATPIVQGLLDRGQVDDRAVVGARPACLVARHVLSAVGGAVLGVEDDEHLLARTVLAVGLAQQGDEPEQAGQVLPAGPGHPPGNPKWAR
ncbi:hypothetical protein ACIQZO_36845 [Streptomyces sp. NPDC097617]|uniref:hypothetical protein n=1 Tax=Streptomyces sp. NPDC097617 TaxID=3366091 RepID=UPI003826283C